MKTGKEQQIDRRGWEAARVDDVNLLLELTDHCNHRCVMCKQSRSHTMHADMPKSYMKFELLKKIIGDIQEKKMRISSLNPLWIGEAMVHPHFKEMVRYIFEENKKHDLFRGFVLNTNASLMDKETADIFLDYARFAQDKPGYFFRLIFSLDAFSPQTYAKVRNVPSEVLASVISNIKYLVRERRHLGLRTPDLTFVFIVMEQNQHEALQFAEYWKNFLQKESNCPFDIVPTWPLRTGRDAVYFRQLICTDPDKAITLHREVVTRLKLVSDEHIPSEKRKVEDRKPCGALWRTPNVTATGIVTPCCRDLELTLKMGDLKGESLHDIWNGGAITDLRIAHIRGDLKKYPTCLQCVEPEGGTLSDEEIAVYLKTVHEQDGIPFEENKKIEKSARVDSRSENKTQKDPFPLNVCLISREYPPETGWGGIGAYTFQLAHGLAGRGHQVHVIAQSFDRDKAYKDKDVFVHRVTHKTFFYGRFFLKEFALRLEYGLRVNSKVRELIKKHKIDIVEAPNLSAEAFVYSLYKQTPLVTRLHTHFSEVIDLVGWKRNQDFNLSCYLENAAILRSDLVLCSTLGHAETMSLETGLKREMMEIIPLGIPLLVSVGKDVKNKNPTVLFVGRLEKRKGIQTLIQAIPFVLELMPDAVFNIVGRDTFVSPDFVSLNGSEKESFKAKLIEALPQQYHQRVNFLGYVDDEVLAQHYRSCDVFVAPSLYESFGLIYIEAMAYGKAVIGCGVGGVPEVIDDGVTGLLVPPEDHGRLAGAIVRLLKDPSLRQALGQRAKQHVETHFSRDLMVERTLNAYQRVLRKK